MSELYYLSASEQLRQFAAGTLSPVEVLRAQIDRYEQVGRLINAVTYTHFDEALAAAQESERRYRRGEARPLEGITVALKDQQGKAGWPLTQGSRVLAENRAAANHPIVDKLEAAGAIIHLQTTVPELCLIGVTWSNLWGVTRNPWNLECSPGGSSGGSAAALAAGLTTLATGSDMGGSIRIPCALCGLYGFKPPYGRVAMDERATYLLQSVSGPLARTFEDVVRMQNAISGPAPYSPSSLRPRLELPLEYGDIHGWRIAYDMDQSWAEIDPDIEQNTLRALDVLREQGALVEEVDLALGLNANDLGRIIGKAWFSGVLAAELASLADRTDAMTSYGKMFVEVAGRSRGGLDMRLAAEAIHAIYRKLQDKIFLAGYRALVTPTLATSRIKADFDPTRDPITINDKPINPHGGWILTGLFNLCNWNPVVAAPTGWAANGVPTGMQIVAATYDDATAFQVAAAYARAAEPMFSDGRTPRFGGE